MTLHLLAGLSVAAGEAAAGAVALDAIRETSVRWGL